MTLPRGYRRLGHTLLRELTRVDDPSIPYRFVVFGDDDGTFRWRFLAPNGRIVAASGEAYLSEDDCKAAIVVLCREAKSGTAIEFDRSGRG